jgi:hypothetical protein
MNTVKVASVMARLMSLQILFSGLIYLTYVPDRLFMASHARTLAVTASSRQEVGMLIFRFGLHVLVSAILWFMAQPIANWLTMGLAGD